MGTNVLYSIMHCTEM